MRRDPNYLLLTICQLVSILLITAGSTIGPLVYSGILVAAGALCYAAFRLSSGRFQFLVITGLAILALLPVSALVLQGRPMVPGLAQQIYLFNLACWLLLTFIVSVVSFRRLMSARFIGRNEIYGAISLYLLIGVLFAQVYQLLLRFDPQALYFDPTRFPEETLIAGAIRTRAAGEVLYYSFVTLATVGYGDVTPGSSLARSLSLIEAVIGILYVATMIARFVSIQGSETGAPAQDADLSGIHGADAPGERFRRP